MEHETNKAPAAARSKARWLPVLGLGSALVVLFFFDPVQHGFYPTCWFHRLTGWNCPACGGLRATHELLHGHLAAAFHNNPLFVVLIPFLMIYFLRQWLRRAKPPATRPGPILWPWVALAVLVVFGVLRNLPGPAFAWMSPSPTVVERPL